MNRYVSYAAWVVTLPVLDGDENFWKGVTQDKSFISFVLICVLYYEWKEGGAPSMVLWSS